MAVSHKLLRKAAKARKRREHETQRQAELGRRADLREIGESMTYWVEQGENLATRPLPRHEPDRRPPNAVKGRWIARSDLRVGDRLLALDGAAAIIREAPTDPRLPITLQTLPTEPAQAPTSVIRATPNHPWYVKDRGWVATIDLRPGNLLRTSTGEWRRISHVEDNGEVEPVYNLQVAEARTYYVREPNGRDVPVLVHNRSPEGPQNDPDGDGAVEGPIKDEVYEGSLPVRVDDMSAYNERTKRGAQLKESRDAWARDHVDDNGKFRKGSAPARVKGSDGKYYTPVETIKRDGEEPLIIKFDDNGDVKVIDKYVERNEAAAAAGFNGGIRELSSREPTKEEWKKINGYYKAIKQLNEFEKWLSGNLSEEQKEGFERFKNYLAVGTGTVEQKEAIEQMRRDGASEKEVDAYVLAEGKKQFYVGTGTAVGGAVAVKGLGKAAAYLKKMFGGADDVLKHADDVKIKREPLAEFDDGDLYKGAQQSKSMDVPAAPAATSASKATSNVKSTLDALPGKVGKKGPIKEVSDAKALDDLFISLTTNAKTVPSGTYKGVVKELPDGTIVRMRPASKSGGATLDITLPGGKLYKVHIK
jgi:hypothetical protein